MIVSCFLLPLQKPDLRAQDFAGSVFDVAYGVLGDVGSVQGLLGQVQAVLDVDINATDISADLAVRIPSGTPSIPSHAPRLQPANSHCRAHVMWSAVLFVSRGAKGQGAAP